MDAYAVVQTGGKQYLVKEDDTLTVERLDAEAGADVKLEPVLARSNGEALEVGTPAIDAAAVTSTVVEHIRGPKLINFKKKRRKGYSRKVGHRQELTVIKVKSIA
ncbi:MAG: 50S ribosomal protein L21 [Kiritimatiellia bacterium]|jgi:large subunit ribosomal protein L21|nr:50S ribosomal protein L21 [Planctomycetota bacterium]MDP6630040.1 50S ribosomal protein L21 [Kiritimatiellia bacterium]